jgi:hypothetical protein
MKSSRRENRLVGVIFPKVGRLRVNSNTQQQ